MPLRLDIKKKMTQRSDRVKSVDMHPTEPWVLCALYSGKCVIYNYSTGSLVKSFDLSDLPARCAKFIPRKQWIIVGSDDMQIRVFNYNTMERVAQFEGHADYIRYIEVHPTQPYVLSSSDDMTVKLWDWEKNWACVNTYEGHAHYVMMVKINPKDTNTFATASLDRSVKVWSLTSSTPNFSLEGHERGVNCVDYYPGGDKPYIVSGADDGTLRVWDFQTRSCVATLEGHTNNVCAVAFHTRLPVIISGSEDGTVRVWHNTTYRLESTLNYGFERAWTVAVGSNTHKVALGFDDGTIVVKLGKEMPVSSMDKNGKLIISRNNVIYSASVRSAAGGGAGLDDLDVTTPAPPAPAAPAGPPLVDGEAIPVSERELGSVELFPVSIQHNSNGRFVAVVGDNEYVIYTAQALRNKSFGQALDFVWSAYGTGDYAVRESTSKVKIFRNFKESPGFRPGVSAEALYGGALLCVRSADTVIFYDWETEKVVRRIEVAARGVYWNESGELVVITTDDGFFVLRYSRDAWLAGLAAAPAGSPAAATVAEEGVEEAMELQHEMSEKVRRGGWVGDCFIYTNAVTSRLQYYVGGVIMTLAHIDRPLYYLGYLPREGRIYLMDKTGAIVSYGVLLSLLEYQTCVVRRDFATANSILPTIPRDQYNSIAKFLEGQGFKAEALAVADDPDIKFELAMQLNKLDTAYALLKSLSSSAGPDADAADLSTKWKALMDLALARSDLRLAEECALAAKDVPSLLLLYSSTGDAAGMRRVAAMAKEEGAANIAFLALFTNGMVEDCAQLLAETGRVAEATFFARTYCPSLVPGLMAQWKADVATHSRRAADALADPESAPERFPELPLALHAEHMFRHQRDNGPVVPASAYPVAKEDLGLDLLAMLKAMEEAGSLPSLGGGAAAPPPAGEPAAAPAPAAVAHEDAPAASASRSASTLGGAAAVEEEAAPVPAAVAAAAVAAPAAVAEEEDFKDFDDEVEGGGAAAPEPAKAAAPAPAPKPAAAPAATADDFDVDVNDWN